MQVDPGLAQRLSPALVAFAQLLALSPAQLEAAVEAEVASNPALERAEARACPGCGLPLPGPDCRACRQRGEAPSEDRLARFPAGPGLGERLLRDAAPVLADGDGAVAEYIVGSLDDRGFLTEPPEDIARALGQPPARVRDVLGVLREAWPVGVGTRDVRECLLAQFDALEAAGEAHPLARAIVAGHLLQLARGAYGEIAAEIGATRTDVLAARDVIRCRLQPYPALDADGPRAGRAAVAPDFGFLAFDDDPESLDVVLFEPLRIRAVISPLWAALARGQGAALGPGERERVQARVRSARAFLDRLEERWRATLSVARLVAERQHAYIRSGDQRALHPLTRAEVASALGVHESTVGRAVAGRHVLLPSGRVVPFALFFRPSLRLQAALAEIVAHEARPLSDAELAGRLYALGFRVARRTVAKHRDRLGILPVGLR